MVRVRQGEAADLPRLVEIASHSATAAQWNQAEYLKLFAPEPVQTRAALVVEQDGEVVGFIVGRQVELEWEIENIAVTGSARRRGLGSRLLGEFLDLVREKGGKEVFLEVRESNLPPERFTRSGRSSRPGGERCIIRPRPRTLWC